MKFLLAIIILTLISIIGSRITFLNRRLTIGFRNIILTGTEYIFIGILLGATVLNILDFETLKMLEPFLIFGLCWIGFLFGLQFEVRQLKNLPRFYFSITAVQSVFTFFIVTFVMIEVFKRFSMFPENVILIASLTLGSTASCTAQSAIAIVSMNYRIKNRGLLSLMRYISSVDGLFALCFFAAALTIVPLGETVGFDLLKSLKWIVILLAAGIIPALILISLSMTRFSQQEQLVFLIGIIMFCGGLADKISLSPLISGFICGITTANFSRHRIRALSTVIHMEKSIYIFLLLMIGAGWHFTLDYSLLVAVFYIILRFFGKIMGAFLATRAFKPIYKVPPLIGLGLISEGGLAVAIIVNYKLMFPDFSNFLVTLIVISVFVNEYFSPKLILSQFSDSDTVAVK